jgi:pyruvate-formate lyase
VVKLFEQIREHLEKQYLDVSFDPSSGSSPEEIAAELELHCKQYPDEPQIMTKAWLFHLLCTKGRITVDTEDYFVDKLEHDDIMFKLRTKTHRSVYDMEFGNEPTTIPGFFDTRLDVSHTCPDWNELFKYGLVGLRDRAAQKEGVFYQAIAIVYDGAIELVKRWNALYPNPSLAALAEREPQTLREAMQLACIYHELLQMDGEPVRSMGGFDQIYYDFYRNDIESGRLNRDEAKELIKFFWIKFWAQTQGKEVGKNFFFGPVDNELSFLGFEVYREMNVGDPKLSLRLSKDTSPEFLETVVRCIHDGLTSVVILNDERWIDTLIKYGKTPEDARNYVPIGCYEPAVMGKELNCPNAVNFNIAKGIELMMQDISDDASFEELYQAYLQLIIPEMDHAMNLAKRFEKHWNKVNPAPFLSGTMIPCMESGHDVTEAGAKYNTTGFICIGIGSVADSLAAIEQLVYKDKVCSLAELKKALAADWNGYEQLRLIAINNVPKWGNNNDQVDHFAVEVADYFAKHINSSQNARGGYFTAALYSINYSTGFGKATGALPDGRKAGEPVSRNTGAMTAMDKNGVTALINSLTKIDLMQFPSATILDIMFHPTAVSGEKGIQTIIAIIHSLFEQGGMAVQFNIFDVDILRDAQIHPENYSNLQVRVCGWNVRFTDLELEEQELFIASAEVAS